MKKIVALLMLCVSFMFAAINLQTATKEELMSIKGIGDKKADSIIEYRKTNKINEPEDLKNIKGFGDSIVSSVKKSNMDTKEKVEKKMEKKIENNSQKK
jgi:competence protein ComEA